LGNIETWLIKADGALHNAAPRPILVV